MFCIHCGTRTVPVGIQGEREAAFTCPNCHRVQILSKRTRPGGELCMIDCLYLYENSLQAAGQLPASFQPDLFQGELKL